MTIPRMLVDLSSCSTWNSMKSFYLFSSIFPALQVPRHIISINIAPTYSHHHTQAFQSWQCMKGVIRLRLCLNSKLSHPNFPQFYSIYLFSWPGKRPIDTYIHIVVARSLLVSPEGSYSYLFFQLIDYALRNYEIISRILRLRLVSVDLDTFRS